MSEKELDKKCCKFVTRTMGIIIAMFCLAGYSGMTKKDIPVEIMGMATICRVLFVIGIVVFVAMQVASVFDWLYDKSKHTSDANCSVCTDLRNNDVYVP